MECPPGASQRPTWQPSSHAANINHVPLLMRPKSARSAAFEVRYDRTAYLDWAMRVFNVDDDNSTLCRLRRVYEPVSDNDRIPPLTARVAQRPAAAAAVSGHVPGTGSELESRRSADGQVVLGVDVVAGSTELCVVDRVARDVKHHVLAVIVRRCNIPQARDTLRNTTRTFCNTMKNVLFAGKIVAHKHGET